MHNDKGLVWTSLLTDLLLGLLLLNVSSALVVTLWIYVSIRLAVFVIVFGAFGLFVGMMSRPRLAPLFLFFFVLSGYEAIVLEEYIVAKFGGEAHVSQLKNAPDFYESSVFQFTEGEPRLELFGVSSVVSKAGDNRTGASFSYVVPYVYGAWTPAQPVTVWAACTSTKAGTTTAPADNIIACGDFGQNFKRAVAVPESGYFRAVDSAVRNHDLKSADNALLVVFTADPVAYIYERESWAIWFPVLINGLFLLVILGLAFRPQRMKG